MSKRQEFIFFVLYPIFIDTLILMIWITNQYFNNPYYYYTNIKYHTLNHTYYLSYYIIDFESDILEVLKVNIICCPLLLSKRPPQFWWSFFLLKKICNTHILGWNKTNFVISFKKNLLHIFYSFYYINFNFPVLKVLIEKKMSWHFLVLEILPDIDFE